jgi:hypothetical protein
MPKKLTTKEIIDKFIFVWGEDINDYSLVEYNGYHNKVKIKCIKHNYVFEQTPNNHLVHRQGCHFCEPSGAVITTEEFIKKAITVHGDKYSYDNVVYSKCRNNVEIICKKHGIFEQFPEVHLRGGGCSKCYDEKRSTNQKSSTGEFIEKAKIIHGDIYDYSLVNYIRAVDKIKIICKKHGIFEQTPDRHLSGSGCILCGINKAADSKRMSVEDFIKEAKKVHGDKYDYNNILYKNCDTKVEIICKKHGIFKQAPKNHLKSDGCPKCSNEKRGFDKRLSQEEFIKKAMAVHGNIYDYSKVNYETTLTKVIIICPIHGEFEQTPNKHLDGSGCNLCNSSRGEKAVRNFLNKNKIKFTEQKTFDDCIYINKLKFDFYLPVYNILVEFQGIQHYQEFKTYFHKEGRKSFEIQLERDKIKKQYCIDNNIRLIEIPYYDIKKIDNYLKEVIT